MNYGTKIIISSFALLLNLAVAAQELLQCPTITTEQYPALIFIEEARDQDNLYVAYFNGKSFQREKILSEKSLHITQLDNAIFLATQKEWAEPRNAYAINLNSGKMCLLAENTRIPSIRSAPQRKKAILIEIDWQKHQVSLIELDLTTFKTTVRHTLTKNLVDDIVLHSARDSMKLSPDFKNLAYVSREPSRLKPGNYVLKLLDLSTMKSTDLDMNMRFQLSVISSGGSTIPPFEWVNNNRIIYLHIEGVGKSADHIFKIVDINSKKTTESIRQQLPLTLAGDYMDLNPLNGEITYRGQWVIDLDNNVLVPKRAPFSVQWDKSKKETTIFNGNMVLHRVQDSHVRTCISPSRKHFAYSFRTWTPAAQIVSLYAKIAGLRDPLKVAEDKRYPIIPVAWIE